METQHLTYFKIENFKRFDSFEMSNLGQFNLIVGDNNVGKTSVLEALTFDEERVILLYKLALSFINRNDVLSKWNQILDEYIYQKHFWIHTLSKIENPLEIWHKFNDGKETNVSIKFVDNNKLNKQDITSISKQIPLSNQPELWVRYYKNKKFQGTFGRYGAECKELHLTDKAAISDLLRLNVSYNSNHTNWYYRFINPSREQQLVFEEGLRYILKNLDKVQPHKILDKEILGIFLKGDDKIHPITQFGDGLVKIMRVLLGIISCKDKRIMIDEIDAGIHFTRLKEYWNTIIQLCTKYNVQLFATTHSLECQRAFVEALEDSDMQQYQKDARNISLIENKQGNVETVTFDFEQFEYALNIDFNTRGGKV